MGEPPYPPDIQAAARAGTLLPNDYTDLNHSFAEAAGGVISTASDLATWIQALVAGRVLDAAYQRRWLDSLQPEDPSKPDGQQYGYGIAQLRWGPNTVYFHGGETPGYNSYMGYDPTNQVTLVMWTNLTVSLDDQPTANTLWAESARSDLRGVTADGLPVADRHPLVRISHYGTMHHYRSEESVESGNRGNRVVNCPSRE